MKLGWKRSPNPAPTAAAPLSAATPSSAAPTAAAPSSPAAPSFAAAPLPAPSAEPCQRRCIPRIRRTSYWVRSSLITDTSVVCSNCGQPLDSHRPASH